MSEDIAASNRRRDERYPVTLQVDYEDAGDLLADYAENLSAGGICVVSRRMLAEGTEVRIVLSFPGLVQPFAVRGVVRWCKPDGPTVGIEFADAAANDRLHALVMRVRDRDPALVKRAVRVLVVEDNPHIAQLLQEGLGLRSGLGPGFAADCVVAGDGRAALAMLHTRRFDALIVDVYLPIVDGPTLIKAIRNHGDHRAMPIIAVSCGGDAARSLALNAGANTFIDKPMRLRLVLDRLRELVADPVARPVSAP